MKRRSTKRKTPQETLNDFYEAHGNRYQYPNLEGYKNVAQWIEIICEKHGPFSMSIATHKSGQGCPKCGILSRADKKRRPVEFLLSELKKVHGGKYSYPNIHEYKTDRQPMEIVCKLHGSFWQTMNAHLFQGYGCNKCADMEVGNRSRKTLEQFIEDARKVHGNKYDYSKVIYQQNKIKVCIICDVHGDFWQYPQGHTRGAGCPECAESGFKNEIPGILYIYEMVCNEKRTLKYGISNLNSMTRIKSIINDGKNRGMKISAKKIKEFYFEIGYMAFEAEFIIKTLFQDFKSPLLEGLEGYTEMLSMDIKEDLIKTIKIIKREAEASLIKN